MCVDCAAPAAPLVPGYNGTLCCLLLLPGWRLVMLMGVWWCGMLAAPVQQQGLMSCLQRVRCCKHTMAALPTAATAAAARTRAAAQLAAAVVEVGVEVAGAAAQQQQQQQRVRQAAVVCHPWLG